MTVVTTERLKRLECYLEEDPRNPTLRADAFETAVANGDHAAARRHQEAAQRLGLPYEEWALRAAQLCIAKRELAEAENLLTDLRLARNQDPLVAHDLGYVRLLQGRHAACREIVGPWVALRSSPGVDGLPDVLDALQVLWLRSMHGEHLLEDAWTWVQEARAGNTLLSRAAGVAALIAIDRTDFAAARELADASLRGEACPPEAFVARAGVALAERNGPHARQLLQQALLLHPEDGRVHSTMGMACMLMRELESAQRHLELALTRIPGHVGTWHALGWARLLRGDRACALEAFREALDRDRNFAESHGAVGLLLALQGQRAQALHHLERAGRLDAANVTGRYARALLAGQAGDAAPLNALATQLLDRPGFFGGRLSDTVSANQ